MSTYAQATGSSIQEAFEKFHAANPDVFLHIVKQADRALRARMDKFSVKQILGYVRWEIRLETKEDTLFTEKGKVKKFKINDAYSSRYARLLVMQYPYMEKYIEMREIRSV